MRTIHFTGTLAGTMAENTRPHGWAGSLQVAMEPGLILAVDVVGPQDLYFDARMDALTGTVLIWNTAAPDYEGFARVKAVPALNFSLRVFLADGTVAMSDQQYTVAVQDVDDTPPSALAFDSGGTVAPGAIGAIIGHLAVTDADTRGMFTYTIGDADAWMYEVVGDTLKLRDGMAVSISDGPYRAIVVDVSDGRQSAAFRLDIAVQSPVGEGAVLDLLKTWETRQGFSYRDASEVWAARGAWEVERVEAYGGGLLDVVMRDGHSIWLPRLDRLQFLDGTIDMRPNGAAAKVNAMYEAVLGRPADAPSLWNLSQWVESGSLSMNQLAQWLIASPEFQVGHGKLSNEGFIRTLYLNTEGGTPFEPHVLGWADTLARGFSREDAAANFAQWNVHTTNMLAENPNGYWMQRPYARELAAIYDVALNRLPDRGGFEFWMAYLNAGVVGLNDLASLFGQSPDFQSRFAAMSQAQFVHELYNKALEREPDLSGFNFWVGHLNAGTLSRADMVQAFGFSAEMHSNLSILPLGEPFL